MGLPVGSDVTSGMGACGGPPVAAQSPQQPHPPRLMTQKSAINAMEEQLMKIDSSFLSSARNNSPYVQGGRQPLHHSRSVTSLTGGSSDTSGNGFDPADDFSVQHFLSTPLHSRIQQSMPNQMGKHLSCTFIEFTENRHNEHTAQCKRFYRGQS